MPHCTACSPSTARHARAPRPRRPRGAAGLAATALAVALLGPTSAGAQILRVPQAERGGPPILLAAEIGFLDTQGRYDGPSQTVWGLGQAVQYRASLAVGTGIGAFGVSASTATLPVTVSGGLGSTRGDVDLRMFLGTFRSPDAPRLHQIIEIGIGLAQWTALETDAPQPTDDEARNAFALQVGYGIGIPLGGRATLSIIQDLGTLVGSGKDLPSGTSRIVRQYTTRVGLRVRLAGRPR